MPVALLTLLALAHAEGTDQLGTSQALQAGTVLHVDIIDGSESMAWSGLGDLVVTAPDGTSAGTLSPGGTLPATQVGTYELVVQQQQTTSGWDLAVDGAVAPGGRLWSLEWRFNAGSFAESAATDASFYAVVPGGSGHTAVLELDLTGLAGYVYTISANGEGVLGAGGASVPAAGRQVAPTYPIYLTPPTEADYVSVVPGQPSLAISGALASVGLDGQPLTCDLVAGASEASFAVDSPGEGTAHVQCDLDGDGVFERTGGRDLLRVVPVGAGGNAVPWDGLDGLGDPVAAGDYTCRVEVHTGEFHYVGQDIETSFEGLRLFEVDLGGGRRGLPMFFNDQLVQGAALTMGNGQVGLASSGEDGLPSGDANDPAQANVNARSWGAFSSGGKGNQTFLDTYTWLRASNTTSLSIRAVDPALDTDGDGLGDHEEACRWGTDPLLVDTDGDGVDDATEAGASSSAGLDGGLESHGGLAEALALRRLHGQGTWRSASGLSGLAPEVGPDGSVPVRATPGDLIGLTEATDVHAVDYVTDDGVRVGTVLLLETTGELYPHTKAICDRASGARLGAPSSVDLALGAGVAAWSWHDGAVEEHVTVQLLDGPDGWLAHGGWLLEEAPEPAPGQRVVAVQAWSSRPGGAEALAEEVLASAGAVTWTPHRAPPESWFVAGSTEAGRIEAEIANPDGATGELVAMLRTEDGSLERRVLGTLEPGTLRHVWDEAPFLDATVELWQDGAPQDRIWLSDGVYVPLATDLLPCLPETDLTGLTALGRDPSQVRRWSGCATADVLEGEGVGRTFQAGLDRPASIYAWLDAPGVVLLCTEDAALGGHACGEVLPPEGGGWVSLDRTEMTGDPVSRVDVISVWSEVDGRLHVGAIATSDWAAPSVDGEPAAEIGCGCAQVPPTGLGGTLVGLMGLWARRRRTVR